MLRAAVKAGTELGKSAKKIMKHPAIKIGIPISLGDNFQNYRIVGTDKKFLDLYSISFKNGSLWNKPMQAIIGYNVAKTTQLKIKKFFLGSHGLVETGDVHAKKPYKVVGILNKTGTIVDNLIRQHAISKFVELLLKENNKLSKLQHYY